MSAQLAPNSARLWPMRAADVAEILVLERQVYAMPWSEGNFIDSLAAGYEAFVLRSAPVLRDPRTQLFGYFLAMKGVDEMHLLNLSVAPEQQGRGFARLMLDALCKICREQACPQLWLEVRVGNQRAREVYRRYGFTELGLRRAYYPVAAGPREDAVLMNLAVTP
ncbi:ribosomal protein S18-alanine N-acetyltransferase [Roseateles oligotrophus]|uniref:[Ribosomal protein bS18]-alanine N-acetyltransferase n=1 Tax=Roseateles oligotrophus TaxID=1769250 RepID=A0ABT2YHK9_9BURK|nr:ribosomal protein S18-alanine N-acetyltransferase [Roseateles oligotrophus]MCV2369542.1 ribosomal protein S18-alanine N-acetyltransferase [Roseateles oligotrophus]